MFDDAQAMLKRIVAENWFAPKAAVGFWPAARVGDDIRLFADDYRATRAGDAVHVAPAALEARRARQCRARRLRRAARRRQHDYVGAFVVTSGIEENAIAKRFALANDDYLDPGQGARRPFRRSARRGAARAGAPRIVGLCAGRDVPDPQDLHAEPYRGIRPAPGYPAQPDHTEKATLFRLLDAEAQIGVTLDQGPPRCGPAPRSAGSISPTRTRIISASRRIERDQVEDYAARKGMAVAEVERWLAPILNYTPTAAAAAE